MKIDALTVVSNPGSQIYQNKETYGGAQAPKPKPEAVEKKVDKSEKLTELKTALAEHDINLEFSRDEETNAIVVNLVNEKTGESILQIPSEISLKLSADFVKLQGQFVDEIK